MKRALFTIALAFGISACCLPGTEQEVTEEPVTVIEAAPEPVPEPEPVVTPDVAEPTEEVADATEPRTRPSRDPVREPRSRPKPASVEMTSVVVEGDAKTVLFLGEGIDGKHEGSGEIQTGPYKVKVWYKGDPVPEVATRVVARPGETLTVTCSSKGKWCREGHHELAEDTGQ